jgi:hypothetical protein
VRRWGLIVGLLVSLGLNVGILVTLVVLRTSRPSTPPEEQPRPPFAAPGLDAPAQEKFLDGQRAFMHSLMSERHEIETLRREVRRELLAESPDQARLETLVGELSERTTALERRFVEHVLRSRAALEPEDERRYVELLRRMPELRDRPGPMMDRRRPGGPPGMWRDRRDRREPPGQDPN